MMEPQECVQHCVKLHGTEGKGVREKATCGTKLPLGKITEQPAALSVEGERGGRVLSGEHGRYLELRSGWGGGQ